MTEKIKLGRRESISSRVHLCAEKGRSITIAGQTFTPDNFSAYVEFYLAHSLPVITVDNTAMHPQVVANSHASLLNKVFNLGHIMVSNDPANNARDRVLGTIVGVEFPPAPAEGWKVPLSRYNVPCIRAVAVLHRQAEGVEDVLRSWMSGRVRWTVSMEQEFFVDTETESIPITSGFIIKGRAGGIEGFEKTTPPDLKQAGWTYVPCLEAPEELLRCFNVADTKCDKYCGLQTVMLFGGLDGFVMFKGTALTPLGKEAEARVAQMLASGAVLLDDAEDPAGLESLTLPLRSTLALVQEKI